MLGLGRVWPVGKSLSHRAPATPVCGPGTVRANQGCQVHGVSSDTEEAGFRVGWRCVKKQCGLVGL